MRGMEETELKTINRIKNKIVLDRTARDTGKFRNVVVNFQ